MVCMVVEPQTRAGVAHPTARGCSKREIIRSFKRYAER